MNKLSKIIRAIMIILALLVTLIAVLTFILQQYGGVNVKEIINNHTKNNTIPSSPQETQKTGQDLQLKDVTAKVVSVNTNANNISFIKVRDEQNKQYHTLYTIIPKDELSLGRDDIISFSNELQKSSDGNYYIIENTNQYTIVQKSTLPQQENIKHIDLSDIKPDMQGVNISTKGFVKSKYISKTKGHVFFTIYNTKGSTIKGVMFKAEIDQNPDRLTLIEKYNETSKELIFEGQVAIYQGELEIIIKKVKI